MPIVRIPGRGNVRFPDDMTPYQINLAIEREILPGRKPEAISAPKRPEGGFLTSLQGIGSQIAALPAQTGLMVEELLGTMKSPVEKAREAARVRDFGPVAARSRTQMEAAKQATNVQMAEPEFDTMLGRGLYSGASSLVQTLPGLAASVVTGNPLPALANIAAVTAPPTYQKYRERGGTIGEAALGTAGETGVEIVTEKTPLGFAVNALGKVGFGRFLREYLGRELPSEAVATIAQNAIDTAVANPDKTWSDYIKELPGALGETAIATLVPGTVLAGASKVAQTLQREPRAATEKTGEEPGAEAGAASRRPSPSPPPPADMGALTKALGPVGGKVTLQEPSGPQEYTYQGLDEDGSVLLADPDGNVFAEDPAQISAAMKVGAVEPENGLGAVAFGGDVTEGLPPVQAEAAPVSVAGPREGPAPGFVRVYHGGSPLEPNETGRMFTTSREYAEGHASEFPGAEVLYTDLPENDPRITPEYPEQGPKQGFTFNPQLTAKEMKGVRSLGAGPLPTAPVSRIFQPSGQPAPEPEPAPPPPSDDSRIFKPSAPAPAPEPTPKIFGEDVTEGLPAPEPKPAPPPPSDTSRIFNPRAPAPAAATPPESYAPILQEYQAIVEKPTPEATDRLKASTVRDIPTQDTNMTMSVVQAPDGTLLALPGRNMILGWQRQLQGEPGFSLRSQTIDQFYDYEGTDEVPLQVTRPAVVDASGNVIQRGILGKAPAARASAPSPATVPAPAPAVESIAALEQMPIDEDVGPYLQEYSKFRTAKQILEIEDNARAIAAKRGASSVSRKDIFEAGMAFDDALFKEPSPAPARARVSTTSTTPTAPEPVTEQTLRDAGFTSGEIASWRSGQGSKDYAEKAGRGFIYYRGDFTPATTENVAKITSLIEADIAKNAATRERLIATDTGKKTVLVGDARPQLLAENLKDLEASDNKLKAQIEGLNRQLERSTKAAAPKPVTEDKLFESVEAPLPAVQAEVLEEAGRIPSLSRNVRKILKGWRAGKIGDADLAAEIADLAEYVDRMKDGRNYRVAQKGRARGADRIMEVLFREKRKGNVSDETLDFMLWALKGNPNLAEGLAISTLTTKKEGVAGQYDDARRLIKLFKNRASDTTAVHEMLHHTERMMPPDVQTEIRKTWLREFNKAAEKGKSNAPINTFFQALRALHGRTNFTVGNETFGPNKGWDIAANLINQGLVPYSYYQYVNPSEFWAVNATDIMRKRFDVKDSTLARIRNWLGELVEKAKGLFNLSPTSPLIKALDSLAKADGKFNSLTMLQEEGARYMNVSSLDEARARKSRNDLKELDDILNDLSKAMESENLLLPQLSQSSREPINNALAYLDILSDEVGPEFADEVDRLETKILGLQAKLAETAPKGANQNVAETAYEKAEREERIARDALDKHFYDQDDERRYMDRRTKGRKEWEKELDRLEKVYEAARNRAHLAYAKEQKAALKTMNTGTPEEMKAAIAAVQKPDDKVMNERANIQKQNRGCD